jgi:hypothetical protein
VTVHPDGSPFSPHTIAWAQYSDNEDLLPQPWVKDHFRHMVGDEGIEKSGVPFTA